MRQVISGTALVFVVFSAAVFAQNAPPPADPGAPAQDLTSLDIESLLNVDVTTASRFADKLLNAPSIMSVVTSDELRRFGGVTLGEVLQRVPGLTASTQYLADRSMVAALGDQTKTAGGHILFLINGRPTREVMEGGIISDLLESFPVAALERIEIIMGPGSVLYGSNAFSAVINLITLKAKRNQGSVQALGGPGDALSSSVSGTYVRGDLSAIAAGQIHDAPDWPVTYQVPFSKRNLPGVPPAPNTQDVSVVDRGAGAYLELNDRNLSFMSAFTEWQSDSFTEGLVSETRLTRAFGNLGYDLKATQNWDMTFNLTFTRTTFSAYQFPYVARDSREFDAEWTNLIRLSSRDRLTAGVLFNRIDGVEMITSETPNVADAQGSRLGGSFYAQLDHQFRDDLKLVGGFQTNKIGDLALDTVPRGGLIWTPSPWSSIKALYGQAFRAPSLDETLLNYPIIKGNPDLLPEKVATFDLGIGFQGNRIQAGVNYFHSKQTNSITDIANNPLIPYVYQYFNLGEVTFNGVQMEGKYYFKKDLFVQGGILYQTNADGTGMKNVSFSTAP